MLNKLKNLFAKKPEPVQEEVKKPKVQKPKELTEKEKATANGEPYISITKVEINPDNINDGSFEFDWNEIFIARLVKSGYMKKKEDTDSDIIDRWYSEICRNVLMEVYAQQQADPENRDVRYQVQSRKLDNGRTEVS
jgi:hypothetical protein